MQSRAAELERMSVNNEAAKHQDDYEFYRPAGSKEESGTGKGFLVGVGSRLRTQIVSFYIYIYSILVPHLVLLGWATWPGTLRTNRRT